jgi:hypothetical protein
MPRAQYEEVWGAAVEVVEVVMMVMRTTMTMKESFWAVKRGQLILRLRRKILRMYFVSIPVSGFCGVGWKLTSGFGSQDPD